jgi:hypothetical protein
VRFIADVFFVAAIKARDSNSRFFNQLENRASLSTLGFDEEKLVLTYKLYQSYQKPLYQG